jgi:YHS domain-containing protein
MQFKNILFIGLLSIVGIAAGCNAVADAAFDPINKTDDGLALRGYDAVAYFAVDKAVEGSPKYEYVWQGAKWLFSSVENLEKFKAAPESYAPEFGGYCSFAVSNGYTADGDPNAWKIVDGKLYLNYSPEVRTMWEKEQSERIKKGEQNWVEFKTKKPKHKG